MLYIVGTVVSTKSQSDPRLTTPTVRRKITWLPDNLIWVIGRISRTPDAETVDYMFYCERNPQRTHTVTFPDCPTADSAIASARGELIVDDEEVSQVKEVNVDEKFKQIDNQLTRKELNTRRGGRPGNLGRRMGR